jgi:hypothetical protein
LASKCFSNNIRPPKCLLLLQGFASDSNLQHSLTNPPNISNVEFGKLKDIQEFYSLMGSDFTKNLTFVDITEYETLDATAIHARDYVDGRSKNPKSLAILQGRANECTDQTG